MCIIGLKEENNEVKQEKQHAFLRISRFSNPRIGGR